MPNPGEGEGEGWAQWIPIDYWCRLMKCGNGLFRNTIDATDRKETFCNSTLKLIIYLSINVFPQMLSSHNRTNATYMLQILKLTLDVL